MEELEIIYRYFTSGLSNTEQQEFNDRLGTDPKFSDKVADFKIIFQGFAAIRFNLFYQKVQNWQDRPGYNNDPGLYPPEPFATSQEAIPDLQHLRLGFKAIQAKNFHKKVRSEWAPELPQIKAETSTNGKGKKVRRLWYAAAAVILLAIGFTGLKWYADHNYRTDVLVQQNYSPRKTSSTLAESNDPFQQGYNAYQEQQFPAAIDFFGRILSDNPRYPEAQLFLAYSYFENKQFVPAEQSFRNVIETGDERFLDNAEWHLMLSLWEQTDKQTDFRALLDAIIDQPRHSFHDEAQALNASLNSFWRKLAKR